MASAVKNFICDVCSTGFTQKHNLQAHIRRKHSTERTRERCLICRKFVYLLSGKLHECSNTRVDLKCRYCDFTTQRSDVLSHHFDKKHSSQAHALASKDKSELYEYRKKRRILDEAIRKESTSHKQPINPNAALPFLRVCYFDGETFKNRRSFLEHLELHHSPQRRTFKDEEDVRNQYGVRSTSFSGSFVTYMKTFAPGDKMSALELFSDDNESAADCLRYELFKKDRILYSVTLEVELEHVDPDGVTDRITGNFRTKRSSLFINDAAGIPSKLEEAKLKIHNDLEAYEQTNGSG